jgi:DNA (cytosine-5)-methyltransferase 1
MRYLSVCSGIEAASIAWKPLGWTAAGFAEIEPFPRAVLEQRHGAVPVDWDHRWQDGQNFAPLFGDFTKIGPEHVGSIDLLVGGTPCQSFSIAGKRLGLDDPRGNLAIEFLALAKRLRARWLVWENVPGVYSSWSGEPEDAAITEWDETADFPEFLNLFRECGYRGGWRTIDAQFVRVDGFGRAIPQRRRRCILVGHFGNDTRAVPVLFDPESLRGLNKPRRTTGQGVARSSGTDIERDCCANGSDGPSGDECQNLVALPIEGLDGELNQMRGSSVSGTLLKGSPSGGGKEPGIIAVPTLNGWTVRKLTPRECERLQGFPDDFTAIQWRGKSAPDGPRYKAIGNSMAVNVMRWIGARIALVERAVEEAARQGNS